MATGEANSALWGRCLRPYVLGVLAVALTAGAVTCCPDVHSQAGEETARFFSGLGNKLFLILGYLALIVAALIDRRRADIWLVLGIGVATFAVAHALKAATSPWLLRPSGGSGGFPSAHTVSAFTLAFLLACRFRLPAGLWYAVAIAIGWSRVPLHDHYAYQVYTGAAIGLLVALLLHKWLSPAAAARTPSPRRRGPG